MKRKPSGVIFAACLIFVVLVDTGNCQSAPELPDSGVGNRMGELLEVVNSADDATRLQFLTSAFDDKEQSSIDEMVEQTDLLRSHLGKLTVSKIVNSTEDSISVLCGCSAGPDSLLTITTVGKDHLIDEIDLDVGYVSDDIDLSNPLTSEERTDTVEQLARSLRSSYVFEDVGETMAKAIEKASTGGQYDELTDRSIFCEHLTDQLREICNDKHLRLRPVRPRGKDGRRRRQPPANYGFAKVEYLEGGIGYLKFDFFSGDREARKTATAAMNFLANSKAIIIDLRENGGGSPDMIAWLSSYLFDEKTHLNSFYNRPTDETTESWTEEDVPGPRPASGVPVFVLTSNYTFSGAEEFSYNLKNLNRGTIIGEVTGGGAHPVMGLSIGNGIEIGMPFARAINPITKTNWEGVGVKPDVLTSASDALETAIEHANQAISDAGQASESK